MYFYRIAPFLILLSNILTAQTDGWNKIKEDFYQKNIKESSSESVQDPDIVHLTTFGFEKGQSIELNPSKQLIAIQTSFKDLKSMIKCEELQFKKNSEYWVKVETKEPEVYKYTIYLLDKITNKDRSQLENYLKQNYKLKEILYISKEEAKKNAKKELGIQDGEMFEEDLFPANFRLLSEKPLQLKPVVKLFPKTVEETVDNSQLPQVIIFDIKT